VSSAKPAGQTLGELFITVLAAICAVVMLYDAFIARPQGAPRQAINAPKDPQPLDGAATLGDADAPVAIIEFADFQCPFCRTFAQRTLPKIVDKYVTPGTVLFAFRNLPLPIHPIATRAAQAGECARRQGRFWQMHDSLFAEPEASQPALLVRAEQSFGLDAPAYHACMSARGDASVVADLAQAHELGISQTPTFLIGVQTSGRTVRVGSVLVGVASASDFEEAIGRSLNQAERLSAR
jgi:protein-disulfide isomerase